MDNMDMGSIRTIVQREGDIQYGELPGWMSPDYDDVEALSLSQTCGAVNTAALIGIAAAAVSSFVLIPTSWLVTAVVYGGPGVVVLDIVLPILLAIGFFYAYNVYKDEVALIKNRNLMEVFSGDPPDDPTDDPPDCLTEIQFYKILHTLDKNNLRTDNRVKALVNFDWQTLLFINLDLKKFPSEPKLVEKIKEYNSSYQDN